MRAPLVVRRHARRETLALRVGDFALARGRQISRSKQTAEHMWEPKFLGEIVSGKDPRVTPEQKGKRGATKTVADLFDLYRTRYIDVEPLKSRATAVSQLRILSAELGRLPVTALERPDAIESYGAADGQRPLSLPARSPHLQLGDGRDLLSATPFRHGIRVSQNERRRDRRISEEEELRLLDAAALLNEPPRGNAKLSWDAVREIRARAHAGVSQTELAASFNISQPLCNEILRGHIWDPASTLTTGDEMRDRIIGALDTGCRLGEMMKIQNKHVDWQHRRIRILKEHSKGEVARVIPFEQGGRLEKLLRRRAFLGATRLCSETAPPAST